MKGSELRIHASSAHKLMQGDNRISAKQLERLMVLTERDENAALKVPGFKPLTDLMKEERDELRAKKVAPLDLGQTTKTMVEDIWLWKEYQYKQEFRTDETQKGNMVEEDEIALLDEIDPAYKLREKNEEQRQNKWFIGTCDIDLPGFSTIEDVKACYTLKQFHEVTEPNPAHIDQGQVYLDLWDRETFSVRYCLVNTPEVIVRRLEWRIFYQFKNNALDQFEELYEENDEFQKAIRQLRRNHTVDHIDPHKRVKTFTVSRDQERIDEMKRRVEWCQRFYDTITL